MIRGRLNIPPWAYMLAAIALSRLVGLAIYGIWFLLKDQSVETNVTESYTEIYDEVTEVTEKTVDEKFVFVGKETIKRGDEILHGNVTWIRDSHEHDLKTESKRVEEEHATYRVTIIASTVGSIFTILAVVVIVLTCTAFYFKTRVCNTNGPPSSTTKDIELQVRPTNGPPSSTTKDIELQVRPTNHSQQLNSQENDTKDKEPVIAIKKVQSKNLHKVTAQVIRSDDYDPSTTPAPPKYQVLPPKVNNTNGTLETDRLTGLELLVSMGLDVNDCIKALKYEQDIQKVADSMFQLKEKAPGKSSGAKTSGNSMEEQGDGESETDDGSQEDETDSNPE